ncbi:MAG: CotH kinase family protein [Crocinitomicaceae bacterium]|nr:CotH kinase family protein [Crocinitomicaceae bacterium]
MKLLLFILAFTFAIKGSAQIDGANLFSTNQVVSIDLDFPQNDFWQQLQDNYENIDIVGSVYIPAQLTLTDLTGTYVFDSVGVRLKGNSSDIHPGNKKAFKIDFNKFKVGQNYDGLKKLNFSNSFKDPTFMREKLFFDLCREHGVPAPRANYANVKYNGEDWGFYTLIEQIDDQFLDWRIGNDSGNLFKAGSNFSGGDGEANLVYLGLDQSLYESSYELKSNEETNDWYDLIDFIYFLNSSSDAEFESGLPSRLDLAPFLSSVAFNNLFSNLDTYTLSARNYYLYHNMSTDLWEWIKWDANETFGSYAFGVQTPMTNLPIDFFQGQRPLLERVFENELFMNQYTSEICLLLNTVFNPEYLNPIIDNYKELIQQYVYADNNKMFSNNDFDTNINSNLGGPGGTIYGLKSFIQARYNYLSSAVNCNAFASLPSFISQDFSVHPNPSNGLLNIHGVDSYPIDYKVYSIEGKCVLSGQLHSNEHILDMSMLQPEMYLLKIGNKPLKVIKQ